MKVGMWLGRSLREPVELPWIPTNLERWWFRCSGQATRRNVKAVVKWQRAVAVRWGCAVNGR